MTAHDEPGDDSAEGPAPYTLTVDGRSLPVDPAWIGDSLLTVLRDELQLTGAKNACDQGECGSCTVLLDGTPVVSCCVMAADAVGSEVTTVAGIGAVDGAGIGAVDGAGIGAVDGAGIGAVDGALTDVQQAFLDAGAVQCGFCTPGLIVATHHLLDTRPEADDLEIREALSGNLCRCTGYGRILQAVTDVRDARRAAR